jgi:leader peptidase (prepilin peptidase)/N-methyltransferase
MDANTLATVFAGLFGLALGSFLNVCIHRIPEGGSLVSPPSSCPDCGYRIRFYDNVPLLSYLLLRGRCRSCGRPISPRYPLVELITGVMSLALVLKVGLSVGFFLSLAFVCALLLVSFIDLQHQIIPDVISLPGILIGIVQSFTPWRTVPWMDAVIGAAAGGGFLFAVAWGFKKWTGKDGMGLGDVKLLAMIGAWMGWRVLPFIILLSSLSGILIGGGALLLARKGLRVRIPFGPFLSIGAFLLFFFEPWVRQAYYGLVF